MQRIDSYLVANVVLVKAVLSSELTSLPGIGPKTARILWDQFESIDAMLEAGRNDIESLPGIGRKRAEKIYMALQGLRTARLG